MEKVTCSITDLVARVIARECPEPHNAQSIADLVHTLRPDIDKEFLKNAVNKYWAENWEVSMLEHYGVS